MLTTAFVILGVAVLLGSLLAVLYLRTEGAAAPWPLAALHGLVAIGGLFCLALALRGPLRGAEQGTASFGIIAVTLIESAARPVYPPITKIRRMGRRGKKVPWAGVGGIA